MFLKWGVWFRILIRNKLGWQWKTVRNTSVLLEGIYRWISMYVSVCVLHHFSCVQLFATLWIIAPQAPLSMGFSQQEHWSGLSYPPPGDLPNPGIEPQPPVTPELQVNLLPAEPSGKPWAKKKWFKTLFVYFCFSKCISLYLLPMCICRYRYHFLLAHWVIADRASKPISGFCLVGFPLFVTQIALF